MQAGLMHHRVLGLPARPGLPVVRPPRPLARLPMVITAASKKRDLKAPPQRSAALPQEQQPKPFLTSFQAIYLTCWAGAVGLLAQQR